ncbi:MAG: hypothetical protein LWW85_10390, partial [Marinilabiliales bacterium]|nr:hypothetical protein [Marinilabiliales bacterium]
MKLERRIKYRNNFAASDGEGMEHGRKAGGYRCGKPETGGRRQEEQGGLIFSTAERLKVCRKGGYGEQNRPRVQGAGDAKDHFGRRRHGAWSMGGRHDATVMGSGKPETGGRRQEEHGGMILPTAERLKVCRKGGCRRSTGRGLRVPGMQRIISAGEGMEHGAWSMGGRHDATVMGSG